MTVHTKRTFAIARSSDDTFERVVFEVEEDGFVGRGEAAPTGRYDQDAGGVADALDAVEIRDPWDVEGTLRENAGLPPTSRCALVMIPAQVDGYTSATLRWATKSSPR